MAAVFEEVVTRTKGGAAQDLGKNVCDDLPGRCGWLLARVLLVCPERG